MIPICLAVSQIFSGGPVQVSAGQTEYSDNNLSFYDKVEVRFAEQGVLTCPSASLDTQTQKLVLVGAVDDKITYIEPDIKLTCLKMITEVKDKWPVAELIAQGSVRIHYKEDLEAQSDCATYRQEDRENAVLVLAKTKIDGVCEVGNKSGDRITGETISFFPHRNSVEIINGIATINTDSDKTEVSSKKMRWDIDEKKLYFLDQVHVSSNRLGECYVSEQVEVIQTSDHQLKEILGQGTLKLIFPKDGELLSSGTFKLDHHAKILVFEGGFITYKDYLGEVQAEKAVIVYNGTAPQTIELSGNVKIKNFATVDKIASETCIHYVLTDFADIDIPTQTVKLRSMPGKRTLVFDTINNVQVSAPGFTIHRDKELKKETIKGEGDIRFMFSEKELNFLKKSFQLIKNAK